jgi:hypothetical protein
MISTILTNIFNVKIGVLLSTITGFSLVLFIRNTFEEQKAQIQVLEKALKEQNESLLNFVTIYNKNIENLNATNLNFQKSIIKSSQIPEIGYKNTEFFLSYTNVILAGIALISFGVVLYYGSQYIHTTSFINSNKLDAISTQVDKTKELHELLSNNNSKIIEILNQNSYLGTLALSEAKTMSIKSNSVLSSVQNLNIVTNKLATDIESLKNSISLKNAESTQVVVSPPIDEITKTAVDVLPTIIDAVSQTPM